MIGSSSIKFVCVCALIVVQAMQSHAQVWRVDESFGENGTLSLPTLNGTYSSWLRSPSGGYYFVLREDIQSFELIELDHAGKFSNECLPNGKAYFTFYDSLIPSDIAQDSFGNLYVGRQSWSGFKFTKFDPFGVRLPEGTSDAFQYSFDWSYGMRSPFITPDGRVMCITASVSPSVSSPGGAVGVHRWNSDGTKDYTYNDDGLYSLLWLEYENIYVVDSKQRLVYASPPDGPIERIDSNGNTDQEFNGLGYEFSYEEDLSRMWEADSGYILYFTNNQDLGRIEKINEIGELDLSFGNGTGSIDLLELFPGILRLDEVFYNPLHGNILTGLCTNIDGTGNSLFALEIDSNGMKSENYIPNGIIYFPLPAVNSYQIRVRCFVDSYGYLIFQESGNHTNLIHRYTHSGMNSIQLSEPCRVYPNPCTTALSIDFPFEDARKAVSIEIIASSGQIVDSFNYNGFGSLVFTEPLYPGMYILRIQGENNSCVEKFIVE